MRRIWSDLFSLLGGFFFGVSLYARDVFTLRDRSLRPAGGRLSVFFYKLCYKAFECWSLGFEAVVSHRVLCCLTGFDEVCTQRLQDAGCFSSFLQVDPRCFKSQKQETNSVFLMEERSRRRSNYWINQMLRESNPALSKADGMCRCVNAYFVDASLQITVTWEAAGILGWVLHHSCSWHH